MSETTVLRSNAIVTNASVGASKPPLVTAGPALPKVQVKPVPAGPPVQQGQQKPVVMLPPKDPQAAIVTGGLPMVQVKMTNNGPKIDDGRHNPVVINPPRGGLPTIAAGGLPMVQVAMTKTGPQVQSVQTAPQVHNAPPRIPAAAPLLGQPRVARVAAPRPSIAALQQIKQVQEPPQLPLNTDQLLLCRHLVDKYLGELRAPVTQAAGSMQAPEGSVENAPATETDANSAVIQLAEQTILMIDHSLAIVTVIAAEELFAETTAAAEAEVVAEEVAVVEAPAPEPVPAPGVRPFVGYRVPPAFGPAGVARHGQAVAYVAPPAVVAQPAQPAVGYRQAPPATGYRQGGPAASYRQQRNAAMAPRRIPRAGAPLPPVIVKMVNGKAEVQNQAEVAEARAAAAEARYAGVAADPMAGMGMPADITGTLTGNEPQG